MILSRKTRIILKDSKKIYKFASYRRSKSYIKNPSSTIEEYELALKDLEKCLELSNKNEEILIEYNQLKSYIESENFNEKNVFKRFFRVFFSYDQEINSGLLNNEINNQVDSFENLPSDIVLHNSTGKEEIRILNVMIDQMVYFKEMCEKNNYMSEIEKTNITIEKAKNYKKKLEIMIETDIEIDNEKREVFLQEFNLSKDDINLKSKFLHLKKAMIDKINMFYEEGKKSLNQKTKPKKKSNNKNETISNTNQTKFTSNTTIKNEKTLGEVIEEDKSDSKTKIYNALWYLLLVVFFTYILKYLYD